MAPACKVEEPVNEVKVAAVSMDVIVLEMLLFENRDQLTIYGPRFFLEPFQFMLFRRGIQTRLMCPHVDAGCGCHELHLEHI
jgi:hypothetical protein